MVVRVLQENNLRADNMSLNDNSWGQNTTKNEFGLKASHGKSTVLATFWHQLDMDSRLFTSEIMNKFCLPVACCLHRSAVPAATGPPCTSCWPTSSTGPCLTALHKQLGFKLLSLLEIPHGILASHKALSMFPWEYYGKSADPDIQSDIFAEKQLHNDHWLQFQAQETGIGERRTTLASSSMGKLGIDGTTWWSRGFWAENQSCFWAHIPLGPCALEKKTPWNGPNHCFSTRIWKAGSKPYLMAQLQWHLLQGPHKKTCWNTRAWNNYRPRDLRSQMRQPTSCWDHQRYTCVPTNVHPQWWGEIVVKWS